MNFADVSHHQGPIDWAAYKRSGRDRALIKATQGAPGNERFVDPMFATNWRGAKAAGLKRGAYHYAEAESPGGIEWDLFHSIVNGAGGFDPGDWACLDAEDNDSKLGYQRADEFCSEFCYAATVEGVPMGTLYTGRFYAQPGNITASDLPPGWRWLHLADYTVGQADRLIELPSGWTWEQVAARQYTDKASVPGIGQCDDSRLLHEWLVAPSNDNVEDILSNVDQKTLKALMKQALKEVLQERRVVGQPTPDEALELSDDLVRGVKAVQTQQAQLVTDVADIKAALKIGK